MKRRSIMMVVGVLVVITAIFASCAKDNTNYPISQIEAKEIAANALGVELQKASYAVVTKPDGKGDSIYTVEIMLEGVVYRYAIDAKTGDIKKLYINDEPTTPTDVPALPGSENDSYIGIEKAKQIALSDAGTDEGKLTSFEYEMDFAYGMYLYKIEFTVDGREYEYEIHAVTGQILSVEKDD